MRARSAAEASGSQGAGPIVGSPGRRGRDPAGGDPGPSVSGPERPRYPRLQSRQTLLRPDRSGRTPGRPLAGSRTGVALDTAQRLPIPGKAS